MSVAVVAVSTDAWASPAQAPSGRVAHQWLSPRCQAADQTPPADRRPARPLRNGARRHPDVPTRAAKGNLTERVTPTNGGTHVG